MSNGRNDSRGLGRIEKKNLGEYLQRSTISSRNDSPRPSTINFAFVLFWKLFKVKVYVKLHEKLADRERMPFDIFSGFFIFNLNINTYSAVVYKVLISNI